MVADEQVIGTTYRECAIYLPRLIEENSVFVLELLRRCPGGIRAEGVALGESLFARGKTALIVSPLSLSRDIRWACYWDVSDELKLADKLRGLISGEAAVSRSDWDRLQSVFRALLRMPPQHRSDRR